MTKEKMTKEEALKAIEACATKTAFVFGSGSMAKTGKSLFMWSNGCPMVVDHGGDVSKAMGIAERGYDKGFYVESITETN